MRPVRQISRNLEEFTSHRRMNAVAGSARITTRELLPKLTKRAILRT
jgi:hypothetical protein